MSLRAACSWMFATVFLVCAVSPTPNAAPVIVNPGPQTSPVTDRYGYAEAVLVANPVGYWRLDDAGTIVSDWAATPHPATAVGGITVAQPGALADGSTAMALDGQAGTDIEIPNTATLDLPTAVTVEAWVKGSLSAPAAIVERTTAAGLAYRLVYGGGQWVFRIEGPSMAQQAAAAIANGDSDTWVHLAGTYDGTTIRLYKNGVEIGNRAQTGTMRTGTGGTARIGSPSGASTGHAGLVDEVAIYPRAVSAAQVASHYALRTATSLVSLQIVASDPSNAVLTYSASGLPKGLEIHPATGLITGNPYVPGTYTVTVTAARNASCPQQRVGCDTHGKSDRAPDPRGLSSSESFSWTITTTVAPNPHRPSVTNPGAQTSPVTDRYGYAEAVLVANPVGYWRLDDAGTTVSDWAPTPHAATAVGGITVAQPGALADGSTAMALDGQSGSFIDIPTTSDLDLPTAVTVEAWVKGNLNTPAAIVERTTAAGVAYRLAHDGGQWIFRVEGPSMAQQAVAAIVSSDSNTWLYLVGTYDGTMIRLYKNGVEIGTQAQTGAMQTGTGGTARIGGPSGASTGFAGLLDEVAIYPKALSAAQIASHYALRTATSLISLPIAATDPENDLLTYSATGLPTGLEIHPATGLITGNPYLSGAYTATVTATDPIGLSSSQSFDWTITTTVATNPHQPSVTNPGAQSSPVSGPVSLQIAANDPDGDVLTYSATGLPTGLDIHPVTGLIAGNPMVLGTYPVTVTVTDPLGLTAAQSFTWAIVTTCAYSVSPLELTGPASGQTGTLTVTTEATCTWSGTSQAPWISLTPSIGIATGNVGYNIDENISTSPRTTTLVLAGQTVQITQGAGVARSGPVTIVAHVSPSPNTAGWNNSAVTVSFTCTNANACSSPAIVTTEGVGQTISGAASNTDHSAAASVTLNIDRTSPTVTLASPLPAPANGALALSGSASDVLSGVMTTTCNGAPASFSGLSIACSVPVRYGINTIVMQAVDAAGNSASSGDAVTVGGTPSFLTISPARRTLLLGQSVVLEPHDDAGFVATNLTWSSDNAGIASVAADGTLTAYAAGSAIVTAASGALSANVTVDVVAGTSLPVGTALWSVDLPAGYQPTDAVVLRSRNDTDFAKVESRWDTTAGEWGAYTDAVIRGLTALGQETFTIHANLAFGEHPLRAMGDSDGGVIMVVQKEPTSSAERTFYRQNGGAPISLVRIATSTSDRGWRQPLGLASEIRIKSLTIATDGTIYGIRGNSLPGSGDQLFGLDVLTGSMKFQIALPASIVHYRSAECPQLDYDTAPLAKVSAIKVDRSGWAWFIVTTQVFNERLTVNTGTCVINNISVSGRTVKVSLYRVSPAGAVQITALSEYGADATLDLFDDGAATTLPGDDGGVFATWGWCTYAGHPNTPLCYRRARYLGPEGLGAEYAIAPPYTLGYIPPVPLISGSGRIGYGPSGAINMATGVQLWSTSGSASPSAALVGGNVLYNGFGTATVYDPSGAVVSSGQSAFFGYDGTGTFSLSPLAIQGSLQVGSINYGATFTGVVAGEAYVDPLSAYPVPWGSPAKTGAPPNCVPSAKFSSALSTPRDYKFAFDDEVPNFPDAGRFGTFTPTEKALFLPQFGLWRFGGDRGFPNGNAITRLSSNFDTANLVIRIAMMPSGKDLLGREFKPAGLTLYPVSIYGSATQAVSDRMAGNVSTFPLDKFGIIVQQEFASASNAARESFLKFIALHEFGHVIGLDNAAFGCSYETSVMASPGGLTLHPVAPTENDKTALRKLLKIQ